MTPTRDPARQKTKVASVFLRVSTGPALTERCVVPRKVCQFRLPTQDSPRPAMALMWCQDNRANSAILKFWVYTHRVSRFTRMCLNFTRVRETTPARQQGFGLLDGRDQSVVVLRNSRKTRKTSHSEASVKGGHFLADQLTLFKPGGQIMPLTLLPAPGFKKLSTPLAFVTIHDDVN